MSLWLFGPQTCGNSNACRDFFRIVHDYTNSGRAVSNNHRLESIASVIAQCRPAERIHQSPGFMRCCFGLPAYRHYHMELCNHACLRLLMLLITQYEGLWYIVVAIPSQWRLWDPTMDMRWFIHSFVHHSSPTGRYVIVSMYIHWIRYRSV